MAGPRMTEQQKADAKAAREAAKAGAGAAADRAEARAEKTAKPAVEAPKPKAAPRIGNPELDQEEKALFLQHLPIIKRLRGLLNTANSNLRLAYKKAKAEAAFTKADFDTAIAVETAENEARERAKIARQLKIAKIMGSSLGAQLDMFLEPDRTPLSDRAFQEGESDAMQNIPARPKYDPSTEAYRQYLDGFHSVSEKRIKEGMGTLHPEVEADLKAQAEHKAEREAAQARDAEAFREFDMEGRQNVNGVDRNDQQVAANAAPSSGVPLTRAQYRAQTEAAAQKADTKH